LPGTHTASTDNISTSTKKAVAAGAAAVTEATKQAKEQTQAVKTEAKKKETSVKKAAKKEVKTEKIVKKATETTRPFALQIASYRTMAQAKKEASRWKKKGYYVRIRRADLGRKGIWYRVYLGRYKSLEEAKRASIKLASKEGIRSYVTKVTQ
ncbi:MAG: SPOR domain-containing protein, partial [Thermodesulfobacteria bacterium]|nr:SPOR domain-containing protein [Thermodesulfobacteriota bacterium]